MKSYSSLRWHIFLVLIIKVLFLYGLWYAFIKPNKVHLEKTDFERLYSSEPSRVPTTGDKINQTKE